jgi:hypothetical protein
MDRKRTLNSMCENRTLTRGRKRPGLALLSALDRISGFPRPRQQFAETVDRVSVDHPREHVTQISVGLDVIKLAGFDQRTQHGPSMTAAITAREEMILPSESHRPFILPVSGLKSRFIIAGTRCTAGACGCITARSGPGRA